MDDGQKSKLSKDKPTEISLRSYKMPKRKQINKYAVMEFQNENLKIRNRRLIKQFTHRYKRLEQTNRDIIGQITKLYGQRAALQRQGQSSNMHNQQLMSRVKDDQIKINQIGALNAQANFRILELESLANSKEAQLGVAIGNIQNKELQLINIGQTLQRMRQQKQYSQMQLSKKDFEIQRLSEVEQNLHRQVLQAEQQLGTAIEQKGQLNDLIQQLKSDSAAAYIQMQGKVNNLEEQRDQLTQAKQKIYDQTIRLNEQISRISQENNINSRNFREEKERLFRQKEQEVLNIRSTYQQMINNYKASEYQKMSQMGALINEMSLLKQVIINQSVQIAAVRNELANNIWAHKSSKQVADYTERKGKQQRQLLEREIERLKQEKQQDIRHIRIQKDQQQELTRQAQVLHANVQLLQRQKASSEIASRALIDKIAVLERQRALQAQASKYMQDNLLSMQKKIVSSEQKMTELQKSLKVERLREEQLIKILQQQQIGQNQHSKQVQIYRQEIVQKARRITFLQLEIEKEVSTKKQLQKSILDMKRDIKMLIKQQEGSKMQISELIKRLKQKQKTVADVQKQVLQVRDNQLKLLQAIGLKGKELYDMKVNEQKQKTRISNLQKQLMILKGQDSKNKQKMSKDLLEFEKSLVEIQSLNKRLAQQLQKGNKSEQTTRLLEGQLLEQSQKARQDSQKNKQMMIQKQRKVTELQAQLDSLRNGSRLQKQQLQTRIQTKTKQLTKALRQLQQQKHNTTFYDNKYKQMIQKYNNVVRLFKDLQARGEKQKSAFSQTNRQSNEQITRLKQQINAHESLIMSISKNNSDIKSTYEASLKDQKAKHKQISTQLQAYEDRNNSLKASKAQLQQRLASLYKLQAMQRLENKQKQNQSLAEINMLRESLKLAQKQHEDKIKALHTSLDIEAANGQALASQIRQLASSSKADKQEIQSLKQAAQNQRRKYILTIGQIQSGYIQRIIKLELRLLNQVFFQKLNRQDVNGQPEPANPSNQYDRTSNAVIYGSTFIQSNIDDKGQLWIGTKITKGKQRFFTRNSVKASKKDIESIIQTYNNVKNDPISQKVIKMINPKLGLIRDIYKGNEYYSIRQFNYYRNKAQPTRNGFNLKPSEMQELTHYLYSHIQ